MYYVYCSGTVERHACCSCSCVALLIAADWLDADDERLAEGAAGGARAQGASRCFCRTPTTSHIPLLSCDEIFASDF